MKRMIPLLLVFAFLPGSGTVAEMCTVDVVPAATLLLPYFEVDFNDVNGVNTVVSINNASATPTLAHVVLWTDWAVPTIDFDVFLTGYDIVPLDLWDTFATGYLPVTADEATDPDDTISPHGRPQWDATIPACTMFFPFPSPALTGVSLDRIRMGHTGQITALDGTCIGYDHGDGVARGYLTVDNVNQCNLLFPSDVGYFGDGGTGIASNANQLWGEYYVVDRANNSAAVEPLIHIEADDAFSSESTPTNYTFYGRYVGATGIDNREPLGTVWGVRYLNAFPFTGGTQWVVWRDPTAAGSGSGPACTGPDWNPLDETNVVCFDEQENHVQICWGDTTCFPLATQKVRTGTGDLALPFDFGWCYLNLNVPGDAFADDVDFPALPPGDIAQSYVSAEHSAYGLFSGGLRAVELTPACENLSPSIAVMLFADGFESGDTSAWSLTTP